jgi:hypothetical protein
MFEQVTGLQSKQRQMQAILPSKQRVGGSNPSGRAIFARCWISEFPRTLPNVDPFGCNRGPIALPNFSIAARCEAGTT